MDSDTEEDISQNLNRSLKLTEGFDSDSDSQNRNTPKRSKYCTSNEASSNPGKSNENYGEDFDSHENSQIVDADSMNQNLNLESSSQNNEIVVQNVEKLSKISNEPKKRL